MIELEPTEIETFIKPLREKIREDRWEISAHMDAHSIWYEAYDEKTKIRVVRGDRDQFLMAVNAIHFDGKRF